MKKQAKPTATSKMQRARMRSRDEERMISQHGQRAASIDVRKKEKRATRRRKAKRKEEGNEITPSSRCAFQAHEATQKLLRNKQKKTVERNLFMIIATVLDPEE